LDFFLTCSYSFSKLEDYDDNENYIWLGAFLVNNKERELLPEKFIKSYINNRDFQPTDKETSFVFNMIIKNNLKNNINDLLCHNIKLFKSIVDLLNKNKINDNLKSF
jgi:hypothetical protein